MDSEGLCLNLNMLAAKLGDYSFFYCGHIIGEFHAICVKFMLKPKFSDLFAKFYFKF